MAENNLSGLVTKVKSVTKQAADATVKQAKIARFRFDLMTVHSEKAKHLQNIGSHLISLYKNKTAFDHTSIFSELETDISNIESLDRRIEEIEAQLEGLHADSVEIKDITPQ